MTDLQISSAVIKGIGGICVPILGTDKFTLPLKSDDGICTVISDLDALYVLSSPYNLIPPQLLITSMRARGYLIDNFSHDDKVYVFRYAAPSSHNKPCSTLTVPIGPNGSFELRTNDGYEAFMFRAPIYCKEYVVFSITTHVILMDDDTSIASSASSPLNKTREPFLLSSSSIEPPFKTKYSPSITRLPSPHKTREPSPILIPDTDADFDPLRTSPLSSKFCTIIPLSTIQEDASIATTRRK